MATITAFIGHFHPLLVHLPIGILLAALLLQWLSFSGKYLLLKPAVPVLLLWGTVAALFSVITGFFLSASDDYDDLLVGLHQWMGISVAFVSILAYGKEKIPRWPVSAKFLSLVLVGLIFLTGHLGGSLTHGSDYLTKPLKEGNHDDTTHPQAVKPLPNVQEALAYNDVIKPILESRCYTCHGANKQKGKLRLDNEQDILKGGKDGKVIEAGDGVKSELVRRLLLPIDNEDHMPPQEKSQPGENQVALLQWWINTGADFTRRVRELDQPERIKPILAALQSAAEPGPAQSVLPLAAVEPADAKLMEQLRKRGVVLIPVAQNSNYLSANFVNHANVDAADLQLLQGLKKQLLWLKMSNCIINDTALPRLAVLTSLTRLSLDHTSITDKSLAALNTLINLEYLNLVDTKVSTGGLLAVPALRTLRSLYLFHTRIEPNNWASLQHTFPKAMIDTGNYTVPTLPTDTVKVKAKK